MSTEFEEFKDEVIAEIRANIHKYPSVCKMLLGKVDRLEAEADKAAHDLKNALALGQFDMRERAAKEADLCGSETATSKRIRALPTQPKGEGE